MISKLEMPARACVAGSEQIIYYLHNVKVTNHCLVHFERRMDTLSGIRKRPWPRFRSARRSQLVSHLPCSERHRKKPRTCFEGPFAEVLRATGPMAKANPFRFSTKYQDEETGLLYYGYRYLMEGRWLIKDPVGEMGGLNLYGFCRNDPQLFTDRNGLDFGMWIGHPGYNFPLPITPPAPKPPVLQRPILEKERGCCDSATVDKGEQELRRRYQIAVDEANRLRLKPASPPNPLWPFGGGGAATCKNSSSDVLEYLVPTPACWQCYLEERNAYSPKDDPKDERRDHQVVICVGYPTSGAKKEIIFDWWGGETSPDDFRREYPYPGRVGENPYWTRCSNGQPSATPPPCSGWQCSRPPFYR